MRAIDAEGEVTAGVWDTGKGVKGRSLELVRLGRKAKAMGCPWRKQRAA